MPIHPTILAELAKLQNEQIRIRPYRKSDVLLMCDCIISSTKEMKPFLPWVHDNYSTKDTQIWIEWVSQNLEKGIQYDFVIELNSTQQFLGGVGILEINHKEKTAKLGYWLRTDATGKGLTTQAAQLAIKFAREQLGLRALFIDCDTTNPMSIRIAEKLGATLLRREKYHRHDGKNAEQNIYKLKL